MLRTLRIGMRVGSNDPYWVQTREAVHRRAQQLAVNLLSLDLGHSSTFSHRGETVLIDEIVSQDLDALICSYLPERVVRAVADRGTPVIHLTETDLRHPLLASASGYYGIAQRVGAYLAERLHGRGSILLVGGLLANGGEDGRSRIAGITDALRNAPGLALRHIPSAWRYEHAYPQIEAALQHDRGPIDAIFGLSDSLALAARDAAQALGRIDGRTLIVGINGDPLALAAIADGRMTATIDTPATEFGVQAVDLAFAAARREALAPHFGYAPRLVTVQNVADVAMQKLIAIAELPSRMVGVNREQEQQRLSQLETSLEISRRIGSILDRQELSRQIAELIRDSYGYDTVQLFLWREPEQLLVVDQEGGEAFPPHESAVLNHALQRNEPVFVADAAHSLRFPPDPRWPETRSRVVVPIRLQAQVAGLLDLHSQRVTHQTRQSLVGLQALADQLGIAMRNAELYDEALKARAAAERADQLKTRLLANVSHELRAPLNVILGYSLAALDSPNPYRAELPEELLRDLQRIYGSGEHLGRLINDLLDLSRAEIGELELFPETVSTRAFLEETFHSATDRRHDGSVAFCLQLPERLPLLQGDPVRLRQILLNLLNNAQKFTAEGRITLGAEVALPHLHIWVEDTGTGIPAELQGQIFEPFVTGRRDDQRPAGAGLGLSITRQLVALHQGSITLESQPGHGSTFHLYLPLPSLSDRPASRSVDGRCLVFLGAEDDAATPLAELCERRGLTLVRARPGDDVLALTAGERLAGIVWDMRAAAPGHWRLIEELRRNQQASAAPFMLYEAGHAETAGVFPSAVGVLNKPLAPRSLLEAIEAMRPPAGAAPVLIVDDDPETCAFYERLIKDANPALPIRVAVGGLRALEALADEPPALVVLDLMMPEVDGFAVLEHMRADPRTAQVPVIVISGQMLSLADIRRLDYGLVTFHSKGILAPGETAAVLSDALASGTRLAQQTSLVVKRAITFIQQQYDSDLSLQQIAGAVGVSKNYLTQVFRQELSISPWEFLSRYRIKQAKALLARREASIAEVATTVGFADAGYFSRVFRKHVGCTPQSYRDRRI